MCIYTCVCFCETRSAFLLVKCTNRKAAVSSLNLGQRTWIPGTLGWSPAAGQKEFPLKTSNQQQNKHIQDKVHPRFLSSLNQGTEGKLPMAEPITP